tara:strand:- start:1048 stop:1413 length:366 start_codon:yes stop_codon:yes gene_type:complete
MNNPNLLSRISYNSKVTDPDLIDFGNGVNHFLFKHSALQIGDNPSEDQLKEIVKAYSQDLDETPDLSSITWHLVASDKVDPYEPVWTVLSCGHFDEEENEGKCICQLMHRVVNLTNIIKQL